MKLILGRIWALWGIIWFSLTLLLIFPFVLITNYQKEPSKSNIFYKLSKLWMQMFLPLVGCPLKIKGKEHFITGENYIVTSNHNSLLDVPLTSPFIPGTNKTIAKKDFMKVPIFNQFYKRGSVLVDRKSDRSRKQSFDDMKLVLESGFHMCIYPEGTRNKTNEPLQPFKDGAFRLAIETNKSIIPCLLFNTKKALPIHPSFCLIPHKLEMHFLPAISSAGETVESLRDKTFAIMQDYYESNLIANANK